MCLIRSKKKNLAFRMRAIWGEKVKQMKTKSLCTVCTSVYNHVTISLKGNYEYYLSNSSCSKVQYRQMSLIRDTIL